MVISDNDCRTAQTQLQTIKYAIIMLPGPPVAKAFPVAMKRPLPILDPREMIWITESQYPRRDAEGVYTYVNLARCEGAMKLPISIFVELNQGCIVNASYWL